MKKLSFEASIQELEEIVAKLENGEESLAVSYTHLTLPTIA